MEKNQLTQEITVPGYLRISKIIAYVLYVWVIIGIASLIMRVFLLAFSANVTTPFVNFIYNVSADYLSPFRGIFPPRSVGETGYLDVAAMFAIIVYLFIMWGFSALVKYVQFKIDKSVHEQEKELEKIRLEQQKAREARALAELRTQKVTVRRTTTTRTRR